MAENPPLSKQYETYLGKTLGNYYLERMLEEVETGPVFLARHTQAKTLHRLRLLALPMGLTPEERLVSLGHFQREASQISMLQHPAILPVTSYGIYQGLPFLVSPDLPTRSLHRLLAKNGPIDSLFASRYLDQITAALEYAHQQGILHLNINALNIRVKKDDQLLIAEFGLVRMLPAKTHPGTPNQQISLENGFELLLDTQGKPLYGLSLASAPAPELLLGQPVDASTDVYALGALLYQMLTGHRVFQGKTLQDLGHRHLYTGVPTLSRWRQGLPEELDRLVSKALAKNSAGRFRSAGEFADAYAQIAAPGFRGRQAFMVSASPQALPAQNLEPEPAWQAPVRPIAIPKRPASGRQTQLSRRRAISLIAVGGSVAAAAGVTVWLVARNGGSSSPTVAASGPSSTTAPASGSSSATAPGSSSATASSSGSGSTPPAPGATVLANTSDVPVNSAKTFPLPNSNNPGLLIHLPNGQFVAYNSTCTHAGCAVHYNPQDHLLECPCHGASFDPARNAAVVGGPAPTPLTPVSITVNANGTITENG